MRVGDDAGAQHVVRVEVALAHAVVDRVFQPGGEALEAHVHADLEEDEAVPGGEAAVDRAQGPALRRKPLQRPDDDDEENLEEALVAAQ